MKKKLSVLLVTAVMLEMTAAVEVSAAQVTDYYADVYGITVLFNSDVYNTTIEGYSLYSEEELIETTPVIKDNKVTFIPAEPLEINKIYTLNIDEFTREFKIKTLFFENFDNKPDGVISEPTTEENTYGKYSVAPGAGEAFYSNGELALANSMFYISEYDDEGVDLNKVTYMMDVKGYAKQISSTAQANAGAIEVFIGVKGKNPELKSEEYALRLMNSTGFISNVDASGKASAIANAKYVTNDGKYGFSTLTGDSVILNGAYEYDTESASRNAAIRIIGNKLSGIIDGNELLSVTDDTYNGVGFNVNASSRSLALIDNVRITYCTEDVIDPEYGEVRAESIDGDFNSLKLTFDRTLRGTTDFSKVKVYENDELINAEISLDSKDDRIVNIVPESYKASNTYKVVVEKGFGTKTMWTYEEFTLSKYLEPQEIKVTNAEIYVEAIIIDLDTEISGITDFDKVKVYENGEAVESDIKLDKNRLTIVPKSYVLDNTYKVVIEKGFGTENIHLFEEYTIEDVLTKSELIVENVTGIKGILRVEFNDDISDITDFGAVKVLKDNAEQKITCKASKNVLNITMDNVERDTEYELFIEKGLESKSVLLKKSYLRKFCFETIIYEDFEDTALSEGIRVGGANITDKNGNGMRIVWSNTMFIEHPDAVSAEQLWVSFDYQLYTASMNNADKQYNSPVPYSLWCYNLETAERKNGYQFYMRQGNTPLQHLVNGSATTLETINFTAFQFGDAYLDRANNIYYVYDEGDPFPTEIAEKYGVAVSQRPTPPVYHMDLVKDKAAMSIYRDDQVMVSVNPQNPSRTTGYVSIGTQITEMMTLDNVTVSIFKLIDNDGGVDVSELKLADADLSGKTEVSGSFIIKNYTDEEKPVRAVIAAYGERDLMQSAQILELDSIEAGSIVTESFTLNKLSNAKYVRVFLWDTLDNMSLYKTVIN